MTRMQTVNIHPPLKPGRLLAKHDAWIVAQSSQIGKLLKRLFFTAPSKYSIREKSCARRENRATVQETRKGKLTQRAPQYVLVIIIYRAVNYCTFSERGKKQQLRHKSESFEQHFSQLHTAAARPLNDGREWRWPFISRSSDRRSVSRGPLKDNAFCLSVIQLKILEVLEMSLVTHLTICR